MTDRNGSSFFCKAVWSLALTLTALACSADVRFGVGAYSGQAAFKDFKVVDPSGKVLCVGDFSSTDKVKGWTAFGPGEWKAANGELAQTAVRPEGRAMTLQIPTAYPYATLTLKAKRVSGPEGFIIATGNTKPTGGEWVIFGGWGNGNHGVEMPWYRHQTVKGAIEAGRWYDVKVETSEKGVRAWLDGRLVLEAPAVLPVDRAKIAPIADAKKIKYNPMIFGQFLEHFDNQVYGGVYDPSSRFADEDGFRKDVMEALREIKCPIVRWPGGCFVSAYHWKDGVGKERQRAFNKAWGVVDPNTFGTDEYVKWCRKVGCEPYICTNAGTGTPEEMSDWVEYCNLTDGKWAELRKKGGHVEPLNVKYWSVGNENYGGWEIGAKTVGEWGPLVCESAKLMRAVDRQVRLLAAASANEGWTGPLLDKAGRHLDYVSIHGYWDGYNRRLGRCSPYLTCMMRTLSPEQNINTTIEVLNRHHCGDRVKIAYDEWNLRGWYHPGLGSFRHEHEFAERRKNDIASTYTMADAVFSSCFLNACLRHSDVVAMACFAPCVNTRGCIFTHKDGIVKRTTWHVFRMYTHLLEANMQPIQLACGDLCQGTASVPVLDAALTTSDDGSRRVLAIANKHPDQTVKLDVSAFTSAKELKATALIGASPDDYNDIGAENRVAAHPVKLAVTNGSVELSPHAVYCIEL